jgi:hypothetical protein
MVSDVEQYSYLQTGFSHHGGRTQTEGFKNRALEETAK